jgi:hypothetical protein
MPDHPPRLFVWRKRRHRARRADGPERILGEWWKSESEIELIVRKPYAPTAAERACAMPSRVSDSAMIDKPERRRFPPPWSVDDIQRGIRGARRPI